MALADVVDLLACPVCAARDLPDQLLSLDGGSARCSEGHAYDVARHGYLNLLGHAVPHNADSAAMVAARERFLTTGAYEPIASALTSAAFRHLHPSSGELAVLDLGSGPGWYLGRVLDALSGAGHLGRGLALDVSPAAARRAALLPRTGAVVADAWSRLPVRTTSVDLLLSVFAPRTPAELARVLRPGGLVLVASPLPDHLTALREAWGLLGVEVGKQERLTTTFGEHLEPVEEDDVRYALRLDRSDLDDLVAMGPNAFHPTNRTADAPGSVEVAVQVGVWRRPST